MAPTVIRPAWLVDGGWQCSYCGRRLEITAFYEPGTAIFARGWIQSADGIYRYHRPRHKGVAVSAVIAGERVTMPRDPTRDPGHFYRVPADVVCRNPSCGETIRVG